MSGATHICVFRAERLPPFEPAAAAGFVIARDAEGKPYRKAVVINEPTPKLPRCDHEENGKRCTKKSVGGARYPWGCAAYCQRHLDEECGP